MGGGKGKIFENIKGISVICRTLEAFNQAECIDSAVIVCRREDERELRELAVGFSKPLRWTNGGNTRQASVLQGLKAAPSSDYYAIHDAARPLISPDDIERVYRDAIVHKASALAVAAKDTCKVVDEDDFVKSTPDRATLRMVQTPQVFERELLLSTWRKAGHTAAIFTDDCQMMEHFGVPVHLIEGNYSNIKITTPEDIYVASALVERKSVKMDMRIGSGYDVHRLVAGRRLILCGVDVPFEKGLLGHSDADVAAHAIADALLGAAALGDIGKLFPDGDMAYKDADSMVLLAEVCRRISEEGYYPGNVDVTIIAQRPKLATYIDIMRANVAEACRIPIKDISVKATTEEHLGFTGAGEGISANAVCMIFRK